jgi:hypothetical protein
VGGVGNNANTKRVFFDKRDGEGGMRRAMAAAGVALGMVWLAAQAGADATLGVLTCTLAAGNSASGAPPSSQRRDALCTFQARSGVQETYAARFRGLTPSPGRDKALMWVVKGAADGTAPPGLLAQSYTADPTKPADQNSPIVGEARPEIELQTMADAAEGSASVSEKPPPHGFVVIGVELTLTASSG